MQLVKLIKEEFTMNFNVVRNDITNMKTDAIVLPANTLLKEGSGTSKAIFEKAGRAQLEKACADFLKKYHHVHVGDAVVTSGYNLEAKYIIHAILPKWIDGDHDEYAHLSTAYLSALYWADTIGCESIAFPLLASGNNKFDLSLAFEIAKESIESFEPKNKLKDVYLVMYGARATALARENGFDVEEIIDSRYVLENDESYKNKKQRVADVIKNAVGKAGGTAVKYAKLFTKDSLDMAQEYFDDEENRKKLIKKGAEIAANAAIKKMTPVQAQFQVHLHQAVGKQNSD